MESILLIHMLKLEELILKVRLKNTRVNLITNGTLYDEKRFDHIVELGVEAVELTINHYSAEVHESLNQEPGSFVKTIRTLEYFKSIGSGRSCSKRSPC